MTMQDLRVKFNWLPPQIMTHLGAERRVGVELELAGVEPSVIARLVQTAYGGDIERHTQFEISVINTEVGKFIIELDASYMKELAHLLNTETMEEDSFEFMTTEWLTKAAEQLIPWELVSPPLRISQLAQFNQVINQLRDAGALGTRSSLRYAFGLHLNPELPALDVATILRYFRAYLCLYDWLAEQEQIDFARKITTYIKHFNKDYIRHVIDPNYQPSLTQFIDDYLVANPTRNRSMDLLPLFAHLDESRVRAKVRDPRVKARPTFHYRLPNCDIDNPEWDLRNAWGEWLEVERLAEDAQKLDTVCRAYIDYLHAFNNPFENAWLEQCRKWITTERHA